MGIRLNKVLTELNIGTETVVDYLKSIPGLEPTKEMNPNTKVTDEQYAALRARFSVDKAVKEKANSIFPLTSKEHKPSLHITNGQGIDVKVVGKLDLDSINQSTRPKKKSKEEKETERRAKRTEWLLKRNGNQEEPLQKENEINNNGAINLRTCTIRLTQLRFEDGFITYRTGNDTFNLRSTGFSSDLNRHKDHLLIKGVSTQITLDYSNGTFNFVDNRILRKLEDFKSTIDNEMFEKHLKDIERQKEQTEKNKVVRYIVLDKIIFSKGRATIKYKGKKYHYDNSKIIDYDRIIRRIQQRSFQIGKYFQFDNVKIQLDIETGTFVFPDIDICKYFNRLQDFASSTLLQESRIGTPIQAGKTSKPKIEQRIQFSALNFSHNKVSINYKKGRYRYRDYNIKDYDVILEQIFNRVSKARRNAIKTSLIRIEIDTETETFTFKDIDINKYVNNLKESFLPQNKKDDVHNETLAKSKNVPQKPSSTTKTMKLEKRNIHFYNGYFLIFRIANGIIDNTVSPYKVIDPDSHEILNLVHNYFEQRFEQMRIVVKHDDTKIFEPSKPDLFQLKNYVRALRRNLDVKGEWWDEVQNARKRSFGQCFGEPTDSVKSRCVKSKNEYLYNLSSLQNERKLIRVYEINHGKEEDAFIFTITMPNDRCAIVFENASNDASTTTWLFVARNENYEDCVNLVFNYFTDYTILAKRSSLRDANTNPPFKFKAESYTFIDHNDLGQWLKKLDKVLERTSKSSDIVFVSGLNIPQSSGTRAGHNEIVPTKNLHNQLMRKLYDRLCDEYGKEYVGTEIRVGAKRIDTVVKGNDCYDIYEVKTAANPFDCVTEALGQLCQYAYLFCRDKIGKMVIVGVSETNREVEQYLSWFRQKHSMEVYYMQVII